MERLIGLNGEVVLSLLDYLNTLRATMATLTLFSPLSTTFLVKGTTGVCLLIFPPKPMAALQVLVSSTMVMVATLV